MTVESGSILRDFGSIREVSQDGEDESKDSRLQVQQDAGVTLAGPQVDSSLGGIKTRDHNTRDFGVQHFYVESRVSTLQWRKKKVEKLWQDFFSNPSKWQDHRLGKADPRFPDFKNMKTRQSLWLDSKWIPPWVEAKLAAMTPGIIKSSSFAFNQRLSRYAKAGQHKETLGLYDQMQQESIIPDRFTFCPVLSACASLGILEEGRRINAHIAQYGLESDLFVGSSLIDMYSKCGSMEDAERVFTQMPSRNVMTWSAMMLGYVKSGQGQQALELYRQMQQEQVDPDPITFVAVLNACASVAALEEGRATHDEIIQRGHEANVFVQSSLVDMYGKCGSIADAERVFKQTPTKDVVVWNAMILGYVKCGKRQQALELYQQMQQEQVEPNPVTFVEILNACASVAALEEGRAVHAEVISRGYKTNLRLSNCLVDMYGKCASIEDAEKVFKQMPTRDVVTWNAMILGYVKCGEGQQALELYGQMQQEQVDPNSGTFVGVLNACASVAALEEGRGVHEAIIQRGYEADVFMRSSLINMYGNCGSIEDAERVFKQMPSKNVVVWTAMLAAYGRHGYAKEALEHFKEMCKFVEVNKVTFVCLLTACNHGGLVDAGLEYFKSMMPVYKVSPTVEHYACVVDILGRASRLCEAENLIRSMPMEPNASVWLSLLGACRSHMNVELAERCAKQLLELEPENSAAYVLLADIYVATGKWESHARVHQERLDKGLKNTPGCSWIEVNNKVHSFVVDDCEHAQITNVHTELRRLWSQTECMEFAPEMRFGFHCVDEERKEFHWCHHSEKLAIAFGLISTTPGTPLYIVKNHRFCDNCHRATKFITKIIRGAIIVRDVNRIHHFEDGLCSCGDYW